MERLGVSYVREFCHGTGTRRITRTDPELCSACDWECPPFFLVAFRHGAFPEKCTVCPPEKEARRFGAGLGRWRSQL